MALRSLWLKTLRLRDVELEDSFFQLGGDSLQLIELVVAVGRLYGNDFNYEAFLENPNLATLLQIVSVEGTNDLA